MNESSRTLQPGTRVGSYILESEIGRGGMGVVYKAHRADSGQQVALKLMLPELSSNERFRERFVMEATLGPDLDHPNIVPVYEAGDASGELFIAMKLVEGVDLKTLIEQEGPLDPKRTLSLLRQVASALDAAHEAGVVHRDVKPQNILIAQGEDHDKELVFVTDFGLVKPVGSESTASRTGQILGSIQYMSPEQVEGISADGRADVYSLGCVLYECLTKKIPFDRPNEVAVLWAHVHEDPPRVTAARPDLPGGLDTVVANALQKHPDDRYLTCGELINAVEAGLGKKHRPVVMPLMRPIVKRIPRRKTEREIWAPNFFPELSRIKKLTEKTNWFRVIATTTTLCLLAAAVLQFAHPQGFTGALSDAAQGAGGALDRVFGDTGDHATSSDDSLSSARRSSRGEEAGLNTSDARAEAKDVLGVPSDEEAEPNARDPGAGSTGPAPGGFSGASLEPKIVFAASSREQTDQSSNYYDHDIWVMNQDGTDATRLTNNPDYETDPDWSPDGERIVYTRNGAIWMMNADGTQQRDLHFCSEQCPGWQISAPKWSPDGDQIAFVHEWRKGDVYRAGVYVRSLVTGRHTRIWGLKGFIVPSWSPNGRKLAGSCRHAPGGGRLGENLCIVDLRSGERRIVLQGINVWTVAWSPDGRTIAFESRSPGRGRPTPSGDDIWVVGSDGSDVTRLTSGGLGGRTEPTWASDSRTIAYSSVFRPDFVAMNSDGTNSRVVLTTERSEVMLDWWGPSS